MRLPPWGYHAARWRSTSPPRSSSLCPCLVRRGSDEGDGRAWRLYDERRAVEDGRRAMSKIGEGGEMEALAAQAASWVVRLHAEDATEEEWLALEAGLAASTARPAAPDEAERVWAAFEEPGLAREVAERWPDRPVVVDLATRRAPPRTPPRTWAGLGAIA